MEDVTAIGRDWLAGKLNDPAGPPPFTFGLFLGEDFPRMMGNVMAGLNEDRLRAVMISAVR